MLFRRKFVAVHAEAAVAGDMDHRLIRIAYLCADRCAKAKAHGAESAGSQKLSCIIKVEMLDCPHLMLANVGGHDGILRDHPCNRIQDLLRCQCIAAFVILALGLEGEDVFLPFCMIFLSDLFVQFLQDMFCIADDMMINFDVFVDLRTVDIDLYDFCLLCEGRRIQCHPVGEPASNCDQKVASVTGHIGSLRTMHADHAGCQWIPSLESAAAHQGHSNRSIDLFREFREFLLCSAADDTAATDQKRFFGCLDHIHKDIDIFLVCFWGCKVIRRPFHKDAEFTGRIMACPIQRFIFRFFSRHIFQDIQKDRSRTTALGDRKGRTDRIREFIDIADQIVAFGDRHGDTGDIDLLERVLADQVLADVAGNENNRRGIHIGRRNTGSQVCCARSRCSKAYAYFSRASCISVRRMGCALFMRCQDVPDPVLVVIQSIVNIEDRAPRISEDGVHILFQETFHYDLSSRKLHLHHSPLLIKNVLWLIVFP